MEMIESALTRVVVLHTVTGDPSGSMSLHRVQPYAGEPDLSLAVPMLSSRGPFDVHYVFAYTDAEGYHHYRTRECTIAKMLADVK